MGDRVYRPARVRRSAISCLRLCADQAGPPGDVVGAVDVLTDQFEQSLYPAPVRIPVRLALEAQRLTGTNEKGALVRQALVALIERETPEGWPS